MSQLFNSKGSTVARVEPLFPSIESDEFTMFEQPKQEPWLKAIETSL